MPLIDPFALDIKRPAIVTETRTFKATVVKESGEEAEVELTLTLRGLDEAEDLVVQDQAFGFTRAYAPSDGSIPKVILFGGRPIAMSFQLCHSVAAVSVAQSGQERYSFEQLCGWLMILGDQWDEVKKWADALSAKAKALGKPQGNASATP